MNVTVQDLEHLLYQQGRRYIMDNDIQTAVCKSLRSVGIRKSEEHQVENCIVRILNASGPEYLLSRISDLKDWRLMHMKGDITYHPSWHKFKTRNGATVPASELESILWKHKDKAFFALLGSLSKAIELSIPSEKQLKKWIGAVRCENHSSGEHVLSVKRSENSLLTLERDLQKRWSRRKWFSPSDITGRRIPGSGKYCNLRYNTKSHKVEAPSLIGAYAFSYDTAPLFTWEFIKDIRSLTGLGDAYDDPETVKSEIDETVIERKSSYVLQDEAISGCTMYTDEAYLTGPKYFDSIFGFSHSVGCIGLLQKPGGKLRTVANPNRFVQWCNVPLGETLATLYNEDGHYTLNQEGGMRWAQERLKKGISLSSFDMSSATDRLDYKKFLYEYFDRVFNTDKFPLLQRSFEMFIDTTESPWTIEGSVADLIGTPIPEISWTVGQPLGLRPSFPLLAIMNATLARNAIFEVDGAYSKGHFACVGDDMIIETRYADAYMRNVKMFNGEINNDKCLVSDKYAEFCSHLITPKTVYPLKPRWNLAADASLDNIEKFTTSGLSPRVKPWVKKLHDNVASLALDGFRFSAYSNTGSPVTLEQRLADNVMLSICRKAQSEIEEITMNALLTRTLKSDGSVPIKLRDMASSWATRPYDSWKDPDSSGGPIIIGSNQRIDAKISLERYLANMRYTLSSTSVKLQTQREWDWRTSGYIPKRSQITEAKKLARKMSNLGFTREGGLLCSTTSELINDKDKLRVNIELILSIEGPVEAYAYYRVVDANGSPLGPISDPVDCSKEVGTLLNEKLSSETKEYLRTRFGSELKSSNDEGSYPREVSSTHRRRR